jgi:hypothetical protein
VSEPIRSTEDRSEPQDPRPADGETPHSASPTRRGLITGSAAIGAAAVLGATAGRGARLRRVLRAGGAVHTRVEP